MSLYRLVYTSESTGTLDQTALSELRTLSAINNQKNDITGILVHRNMKFFQALEGSLKAINTLYKKILADDRHHNLLLQSFDLAHTRIFDDWSMQCIDFDQFSDGRKAMFSIKYGLSISGTDFPKNPNEITAFLYDLRFVGARELATA